MWLGSRESGSYEALEVYYLFLEDHRTRQALSETIFVDPQFFELEKL